MAVSSAVHSNNTVCNWPTEDATAESRKLNPENPVTGPKLGPFDGVLVDGKLLPQCEDLGGPAEPGHQECSARKENSPDDAHRGVSRNRQDRAILSPKRLDIQSPNSLTFDEYGISNLPMSWGETAGDCPYSRCTDSGNRKSAVTSSHSAKRTATV